MHLIRIAEPAALQPDQFAGAHELMVAMLKRLRRALRALAPAGQRHARREGYAIIDQTLKDLARQARGAGLTTYSSLVLRVGEQFQPMHQSGYVRSESVAVMLEWVGLSMSHLTQASDPIRSAGLVQLMADPRWERVHSNAELRELECGLANDALRG